VTEHCHGASAVDVEVACIKTSLKRKAEETLEVPSTIINGCIENSSQAVQGSLPYSQALKKSYEESAVQRGRDAYYVQLTAGKNPNPKPLLISIIFPQD